MSTTIFDDVFRTMLQKMPRLSIPLINEIFHTNYSEDCKIIQWKNEHLEANGEIITDSCMLLGNKIYHIECQSLDDTTMAVRMIEYDFAIALEFAEKTQRRYRLRFPKSAILQLRSNDNTPDRLEVEVIFPDGSLHIYQVPVVKVNHYTKEELFQKNLLMLLPFYVMRYEKQKADLASDASKLQVLLEEYNNIRKQLEQRKDHSALYADMIQLIVKISDHIFCKEEVIRKGIGDVMGGKVLELESERLEKIGQKKGERIGQKQLLSLISRMTADGRAAELPRLSEDPDFFTQMMNFYHLNTHTSADTEH